MHMIFQIVNISNVKNQMTQKTTNTRKLKLPIYDPTLPPYFTSTNHFDVFLVTNKAYLQLQISVHCLERKQTINLSVCLLTLLLSKVSQDQSLTTINFLINVFIYNQDCAGSSLLCAFFSSCSKKGLLSSCSVRAPHCGGFSWVAEHGLWGFSSCGAHAQLFHGIWDLSGPGIEPMSPALTDRFFTTELLGKTLSDKLQCIMAEQ